MGIRLSLPRSWTHSPLDTQPPGADSGADGQGSRPASGKGWRAAFFLAFWGVPRGPIGWVGARTLPLVARRLYEMIAAELDLQPEDELLDVGCGSGELLQQRATIARYVAGLDASETMLGIARKRLRDRVDAGTAELVLGDAEALPWGDGRFSVVVSLNCLKFVADPDRAVEEMFRVLRAGGRAVLTLDEAVKDPDRSGTLDAYGERLWSADSAREMMERAGFAEVSVTQLPAKYYKLQLVRGVKRE